MTTLQAPRPLALNKAPPFQAILLLVSGQVMWNVLVGCIFSGQHEQ